MEDVEAQGGPYRDDPEFDKLSDQIADDVFDITASNGRLWALLKGPSLEAAVDLTADNRVRFRQLRDDIEKLQQWSEPQPAQRFTQHKITREFGQALAEFQKIQKALADKERSAIKESRRALKGAQQKRNIPAGAENFLVEGTSDTLIGGAIELEQQQEQEFDEQLRADDAAFQRGLIQEREEEIQNIEGGVHELNEIFQNLHTVVAEQGTVLDNIENNIYSVAQATRDGAGQLTKAARWQRSSTGRQLCFLLILIIVALVVVIAAAAG